MNDKNGESENNDYENEIWWNYDNRIFNDAWLDFGYVWILRIKYLLS